MKKISIKKLTKLAGAIETSNEVIRFQTSKDSLIGLMTMIKLCDFNMYAVIIPSLTCEVEMSCEPLEESIICDFLSDNMDDENFDRSYIYLVD